MAFEYTVFEYNPYKLPDTLLRAIGLVITCSVQSENIIEDAIADMLGMHIVPAKILTTHMSMQLRTGALRSAAHARWGDQPEYKEFDALITRVERAVDQRNQIAHLTYFTHPADQTTHSSKTRARKSLKVDILPASAASIEAIAEEIYDSGLAIVSYLGVRGIRSVS